MSNPFKEEARKTNRAKMSKEGVGHDSEDSYSRAKRIAKGYASGGSVHSDVAEDKKLIRQEVKSSALKD